MFRKQILSLAVFGIVSAMLSSSAKAGDFRITLPKRSKPTPVQELNREGVEELRKNHFEKARSLFYKAYLFDPEDPFTLNNLGYVAELEGQVDRAQNFYLLASQRTSDAIIDKASVQRVEGQPMGSVAGSVQDASMQINHANVEAIRLLSQGRAPEAEILLQQTLALEPGNAFTLNNFGVAKEMEGDYDGAMKYYTAASQAQSKEPVIVTLDRTWRGQPVSEMAAQSAKKLQTRMHTQESIQAQAGRLNLRGVAALNRNSLYDARQYFQQAFALDPENAFTLNNRGFIAEMDGDSESAQFFYEKARRAAQANLRVGMATRRNLEGRKLFEVAQDNDQKMDTKMETEREARRKRAGPIELKRRDGTTVSTSDAPNPNTTTPATPEQDPGLGPPQPPIPQLSKPATPPPQ